MGRVVQAATSHVAASSSRSATSRVGLFSGRVPQGTSGRKGSLSRYFTKRARPMPRSRAPSAERKSPTVQCNPSMASGAETTIWAESRSPRQPESAADSAVGAVKGSERG